MSSPPTPPPPHTHLTSVESQEHPLSGISGLSFGFLFISSLSFSLSLPPLPGPLFFFSLVIFLPVVHSLAFFFLPRKFSNIFRKELGVFVWLLLAGWKMIADGWYVQLAALWHWYLPLCIYITSSFFLLLFSSVHSFLYVFL